MIIEWRMPAGETFVPGKGTFRDQFARGAFDKQVGRSVPWTTEDSIIGTVLIRSAIVDDDGSGVTFSGVTFSGEFRRDQPDGALAGNDH